MFPPRFPILPRSRERNCSHASSSYTRASPSKTLSRRVPPGAERSTLRLIEIEAGNNQPSVDWRRHFSLLLGLERLLSQDEPHLADGTVLSAHQVDALSGTLTALLAAEQRNGSSANGSSPNGSATVEPAQLASAAIPGEEDYELENGEAEEEDEELEDWEDTEAELDADVELDEQPEDPNADRRFWFEHATGAGKTVAALGFVEASRTGGILILTHRRNLVDQFNGELSDRGYRGRIHAPLLAGHDAANGPVTVETYQWFVRNAGKISDAYTIVICDEAHTALGEKTSSAIRRWAGPIYIGMTATGALIAQHVTDLFPTQTSRFDLAQAARRGVIAPLRCIRIPPGPGVRTIDKVPLAAARWTPSSTRRCSPNCWTRTPFNIAVADLYGTRLTASPASCTRRASHANNVAEAFRAEGIKAQAVSGGTPKRLLAAILADYERGKIDVLVNAMLLAEGWNSSRDGRHAPGADRVQARLPAAHRPHHPHPPGQGGGDRRRLRAPGDQARRPGRVAALAARTRRVPRGRDRRRARASRPRPPGQGRAPGAAGDGRIPSGAREVFERELWRIAVEHLDYGEQHVWAALAGARVAPNGVAPREGDAALRPSGRAGGASC